MLVAVDWAGPRGVWATRDGKKVKRFDNLDALLDYLASFGPCQIVVEPAFESFLPDRRDAFVVRCREEGHDLRRISDRMTPRMRRELELDKTDENDTIAIWHLAKAGKHLSPVYRAREIDPDWIERCKQANHAAVLARYAGQRPEYLARVEAILGPARDLPQDLSIVLANSTGREYLAYVSSVLIAVDHTTNRQEFERMLGLYQNGKACMLRSEVMSRLSWGTVSKRGVTLTQYRRTLRKTHHLLRQGNTSPEMGTGLPA